MSFFDREFSKALHKPTKESIIEQLLQAEGVAEIETKTEIPEVLPMTAFDLLGFHTGGSIQRIEDYLKNEKKTIINNKGVEVTKMKATLKELNLGDYLLILGRRYRINAIPHNRASRKEAVDALKSIESDSGVAALKDKIQRSVGL